MAVVINIYNYNKNNYLLNKFLLHKSLNKFIFYNKIVKLEKKKDIMNKYIKFFDINNIGFIYDFFIIYIYYKKNKFYL
jgi:hypothetical protein